MIVSKNICVSENLVLFNIFKFKEDFNLLQSLDYLLVKFEVRFKMEKLYLLLISNI